MMKSTVAAKIRAAAVLLVVLVPLSACSDATLLDSSVEAQFSKGKPFALSGPVWGGLMSSRHMLEDYIWKSGGLFTEVHVYPFTGGEPGEDYAGALYVGGEHGSLTDVAVNVGDTELVQHEEGGSALIIPYRLEGYGTANFYCDFASDDEEDGEFWVWYGPMPVVVTGWMEAYPEPEQFRSAAEFRAWLATELKAHGLFFGDSYATYPFVITYDEDCVPTQVFP